jgi:hypothetical protein
MASRGKPHSSKPCLPRDEEATDDPEEIKAAEEELAEFTQAR